MAITLDGTNGILSPDFEPSSSTTPTNGLFLPTTNALGFATNSTERLRLDASGNLGLGVTPSAWSAGKAIEVGFSGHGLWSFSQGSTYKTTNAYYNGGWKYGGTGSAMAYMQESGIHAWFTAPSGTAGAAISFTQAMTLDASGNLGVGTTSPSNPLHVSTANAATYIRVASTSGDSYYGMDAGGVWCGTTSATLPFRVLTNSLERARIDSSGNLLVGGTNSSTPGGIVASKSTVAGTQCFGAWNAVDSGQAYLFYGGTGSASFTARYQIYWNFTGGTGTAGFLSDYRQKDNVRRLTNGLDAIKALKPSIYRFKDALEDASGFIAHEVQEVIPQAVSGHKDEVDEDGNPKYQMLDQTHIIPYLTAAIQELTARLEALENK